MNAPTVVIGLVVLAAFVSIVARGLCNRKRRKGSCSCGGCSRCPGCGLCHTEDH